MTKDIKRGNEIDWWKLDGDDEGTKEAFHRRVETATGVKSKVGKKEGTRWLRESRKHGW